MAAKKKGLVIVESPAKAKKISGYLGKDYTVLASMGHVRDLPASASEVPKEFKEKEWSNLGVNVENDFDPLYVVPQEKKKLVRELKTALKDAEQLILATDEDREGESIGWHLIELLQPKVPVSRMVFSEITKDAILKAIQNPRELDENLVSAQETRRVLDRLYGYTLSPLLWKKIATKLSAGRVQSVAVRVLAQRELERLAFVSGTFWDLKADLLTGKAGFNAQLVTVDGKRIATGKDFDESTGKLKADADVLLLEEKPAKELQEKLLKADWIVKQVAERDETRRPYPPFTTSTLQQEANRKLNMASRMTMQVAQRLYEGGLITYMRTDSVSLSKEAVDASRKSVEQRYGKDYLSSGTRPFSNKAKNAQEAHEAIRPAGTEMKTAQELGLSGPEAKLYSLIWKRTVASQMADAKLKFQTVTIEAENTEFRATGKRVVFPGFFRAYVEGSDDPEAALDDQESQLPLLKEKDKLDCEKVEALSHETKPPARYTEATLVKTLEEAGVGRPSTYSSIISTIQDRGYVRKNGKQLIPTFIALAVTQLLEKYFPNLVDLNFTAQMEQTLDDIAGGSADRLSYLGQFYTGEAGLQEQVKIKEETIDGGESRALHLDGIGPTVRVGRYGPYIQQPGEGDEMITASLPDELAPGDLTEEAIQEIIERKKAGPKSLGTHPEEGAPVYLMNGPFGPYVQLGEQTEDGEKPKRTGIPNNYNPDDLTLEQAVALLSLPKRLGKHPETDKVVNVGIGRFGPYILHDKKYGNFDKKTHLYTSDAGKVYDVLTVDLATGVEMLAKSKSRGAATPLRELGAHPDDEKPVNIYEGRYGPYVKHGKINATIPKEYEVEKVTLEQAVKFLEEKAAKKGVKKKKATKKKSTAKKKATKKKAAKKKTPAKKKTTTAKKKTPAKKSAAKKTTPKKSDVDVEVDPPF